MKNLKQHFEDFRTSTPKHIQWLLLGVAFVIVIILLALILTHKPKTVPVNQEPISFDVEPRNLEFYDVKVGTRQNKNLNISVSEPVVITNVKISTNDFTTPNNCEGETTDSCTINVVYKPTLEQEKTNATLTITWHSESQPEILVEEEVSVVYSAFEEKIIEPEPTPEPTPEPVQVLEPEEEQDFEPYYEEDDLTDIVVPNPFKNEPVAEPLPILPPKKCSEFAIPGYDQSGRQIGWIKPERGANYFYPFSDKDCSKPTGKYDMTTGIITSLADGSKIGTDSDHIGYRNIRDRNLKMPNLMTLNSNSQSNVARAVGGKWENADWGSAVGGATRKFKRNKKTWDKEALKGSATEESIVSSRPYDRTFILRQFKPIPATIVSEVRADPSVYGCTLTDGTCDPDKNYSIPVRATVDRNVYSDNGRTIILPTGTLLLGYLDGNLPGPYQAFGRMNIKWYQFIRPDGVEFNFENANQDPYSADAQGRMGVPGHGSTDYVEQMVMPILTALVPAAINMIAPITDTVINQIDLDNNSIVQSGTIRSSEMAKQDVINTWNKVTQKLLVDAIDNTVPPFSIAAGTRINVFSPVDLIVTCGDRESENNNDDYGDDSDVANAGKKCAFIAYGSKKRRNWSDLKQRVNIDKTDNSWVGQVRSFDLNEYCEEKNGKITVASDWAKSGYDYRTVLAYCESQNYQAKNNVKQAIYNESLKKQASEKYGDVVVDYETGEVIQSGDDEQIKKYNTKVLGLQYDDKGNILNPFAKPANTVSIADQDVITCDDGKAPDANGCCTGETFTDMGEDGWNCCPDTGGDCFPPIEVE